MGPMPPHCDGLLLHDRSKGYQKFNCKWGKVPRGPEPGKAHAGKGRRKIIEKPVQICFSLNKDHYEFIKRQAIMRTQEEGEIVTANELMREALIRSFPCPTQVDMFGTKKRKTG